MEEEQKQQYLSGKQQYKLVELKKWKEFIQEKCEARIDNSWINNHCSIRNDTCSFEHCFAVRIIKLSKGFL